MYILGFISIVGLTVIIIWNTVLLSYPFNYLEFNVKPIPVVNKRVAAGESLILLIDFCKNTAKVSTVDVVLLGKTYVRLPPTRGSHPGGCYRKEVGLFVVPSNTPPGKYRAVVTNTYQVTDKREVVVSTETEEFEVINSPAK